MASLKVHRICQNELRLQSGDAWADTDLIFCTEPSPKGVRKGGMPLDGGNLTRTFHQTLERADLPRIRFHDLRHSCASPLLAQGVDLKVVQTVLGHADFYLTANIYQHVVRELERRAADGMDDLFRVGA